MEGNEHMMNWFGIPFMGFIMIGVWILLIVLAIVIYYDAEKRGMNGLLWFFLVFIPMVGFISIIVYLIIREQHTAQQHMYNHQTAVTTPMVEKLRHIPKAEAMKVLDERYARGEITREEYLQMKLDLKL